MRIICIIFSIILTFYSNSILQPVFDFPPQEFQKRRQKAMEILSDGLILIQSKTEPKSYEQHAFLQDPDFYYFTGLKSALGAILVLDGPNQKSSLFVPPDLDIRTVYKPLALLEISKKTEQTLLIDEVRDWKELTVFLDGRLQETPGLKLYTTFNYGNTTAPANLNRIEDTWIAAIKDNYPEANIMEFKGARSLRLIKSPLEIEALRQAGKLTADAFMAGLSAIQPGMAVRELQGIFVKECTCNGSNGIYFWPFIGSGKYSIYENLRPSFMDYTLLNHALQNGELVRIDIGCEYNHYKGDFGRTIPVSGKFDSGQREVWDLLISAYFSGLQMIRNERAFNDIKAAFDREIENHNGKMKTGLGQKAVRLLLMNQASKHLIIHHQGLGGYEGTSDTCKTGMVLAWEPKFAVENQGFYLEDMVLVKEDGYEILTLGVPYYAEDIELFMNTFKK